jgi:hypothetical protein
MISPDENSTEQTPRFFSLLSDKDRDVYLRICSALSAPSSRNKRNTRMNDFEEIVEAIDLYENSEQEDKWKRCLACGLVKLTAGIAVNTNQLRHLVFKCRSSINGSLKGIGYDSIVTKPEATEELLNLIPALRTQPAELKQWTIRTRTRVVLDIPLEITPPPPGFVREAEMGMSVGPLPEREVRPCSPTNAAVWDCEFPPWSVDF